MYIDMSALSTVYVFITHSLHVQDWRLYKAGAQVVDDERSHAE